MTTFWNNTFTYDIFKLFCVHLLMQEMKCYFNVDIKLLIKRPLRDACLCMGGYLALPAPAAPPAPHFIFLITLSPLGGFFSNLAGVCSSLGEFFGIYCSDISTTQRGHMTKNVFF